MDGSAGTGCLLNDGSVGAAAEGWHPLEWRTVGERVMAIASSGNLSLSQSVLSILHEGFENPDTGESETLMSAPTMFQAAQRIGKADQAEEGVGGAREIGAAEGALELFLARAHVAQLERAGVAGNDADQ